MLITEIRRRFQVTQDHGLHLRLATRFARLASLFGSEVIVSSRERLANGKSTLDLLSLAASRGDWLDLKARGRRRCGRRGARRIGRVVVLR